MAESFVDTFKTELISDRVWRTRSQLELSIVEWVAWFNNDRLHGALGAIPAAEFELGHAAKYVHLSPSHDGRNPPNPVSVRPSPPHRALAAFLKRYNTTRPHKALGGIPPAQRLADRTNPTASYI